MAAGFAILFFHLFITYLLSIVVTILLAMKLLRYPISGSAIFWSLLVGTVIAVLLISSEVFYFIDLGYLMIYTASAIVAGIIIHVSRMNKEENKEDQQET